MRKKVANGNRRKQTKKTIYTLKRMMHTERLINGRNKRCVCA